MQSRFLFSSLQEGRKCSRGSHHGPPLPEAGHVVPEVGGDNMEEFPAGPGGWKPGQDSWSLLGFLSRSRGGGGYVRREEVLDALAHPHYTLQPYLSSKWIICLAPPVSSRTLTVSSSSPSGEVRGENLPCEGCLFRGGLGRGAVCF